MMGAPLSPTRSAENARPRTVSPRWQRPPASARCAPQTVGPERRRNLSRDTEREAQAERDRDLFEQRLISATSPALQAKHTAARARAAALQRGTERGRERHVATDRGHSGYTAAQRTTLREFVRQQREAQREWDTLVHTRPTESPQREWETLVHRGPVESPQREPDNGSGSDRDRELSEVRSEAARVAEAIEAAAPS
eukprot:COSAG03_NODE_6530_length_1045_cov_24.028846_1_plen_196_part_10